MMTSEITKPKRGRPPKNHSPNTDVKNIVIQSGIEMFAEKGYISSDICKILEKVAIPKGSFYYYFGSKEKFGLVVIQHYDNSISEQLDNYLSYTALPFPKRLLAFSYMIRSEMEKYHWQRGCLVGNLMQEIVNLPISYYEILNKVILGWQKKVENYLREAQKYRYISEDIDCQQMAIFFWMGWQGAIMQAKLTCSNQPLDIFISIFMAQLFDIHYLTSGSSILFNKNSINK
ncbi:TPA: TetR family transcriptional regulator C-terminal domain-containing protein [Proteus mirabilis]|nr:TetR family transcriptional regulator C-terminal domain-containing protein [Proteus mirabilis]